MSDTTMIEERLRRFAASPDDADWQDVLRRAGPTAARHRPRLTKRRLVAAAAVAVVLALPALALSGVLGFSNRGTPVRVKGLAVLHGLKFTGAAPGTLVRLAVRDGIGVYAARAKSDSSHLCFYWGGGNGVSPTGRNVNLSGGCYGAANGMLPRRLWNAPFPSPSRPVWDMSSFWPLGLRLTPPHLHAFAIWTLVGVAEDRVRSIQVLALSDCHPVVTVPVIDNVYVDAHMPVVPEAYVVARDAGGNAIWHSLPLNRSARSCGLG